MPKRGKFDIEKIRASLFTLCPNCGHKITPEEMQRLDSERMRCPVCDSIFVPHSKKSEGG